EALVLDLADALAGDVEGATDFVERSWLLAVEAVAELEHLALALGQLGQNAPKRLTAESGLGGLVRKRDREIGEEIAQLGLLLVADRLLERDRCLGAAADLLDLVDREVEIERDLGGVRLARELRAELALGAVDAVELLDDVDGHPDRAPLVGDRTRDGLPDPPRRVGRELVALAPVELLGGAYEPDRALLDQVEEREALVAVPLR